MVALTSLMALFLFTAGTAMAQDPEPDTFWIFGALWCMIPLISIIVWVVLAVWVYKDANERGMSGALWALVIIIGGIVGLIVFLIIRRDHPKYGEPGFGYRPGYYYPGYYQQPYYGYGPYHPPPRYPPY